MTDNETAKPVRVAWKLGIGISNAYQSGEFTIARDEWDRMTPTARDELLEELYQEEVTNCLDGGRWLLNADLNDPVKD